MRHHARSTPLTLAVPIALSLALGLTLAACGSSDSPTTADETTSTAPSTTEGPAVGGDAATTTSTASAEADDDEATDDEATDGQAEELFPDVLDATADLSASGAWDFSATLSSPYDSADRYADAWRVIGADGTVYGVRELAHDHAAEQPFTRSLGGVEVPDDVDEVTIEGRDQVSGWGGQTVTISLER